MGPTRGVHLRRTEDRGAAVDALVARVGGGAGGRVGLAGLLADLDRTARAVRVPSPAASWGFRWDREDSRSRRWWPQGITTSSDGGHLDGRLPSGLGPGRSVVVTSAYSRTLDGVNQGSRLSFVDVSDPGRLRYRHVLLVDPVRSPDGSLEVRPVRLHAGGIVWHGDHLYVAGTARGFATFRLDDVVAVPSEVPDVFGYRYVLPVRFGYDARTEPGGSRMHYSFVSLDRGGPRPGLVTGEYGRGERSTRLARYEIDHATGLLRADEDGGCHPVVLDDGVPGMQGAVVVDGTWYVTTSRGRFRLGSVWVGRPGRLQERRHRLPVGPEDISYWPEHDLLWSLSEYPWARYVFAIPRARLG
ncbi:MAG: hypothetical protein WB441_00750 [Nocardioidaceae bacterium]